jgi:hypothetical protein
MKTSIRYILTKDDQKLVGLLCVQKIETKVMGGADHLYNNYEQQLADMMNL